MELLAGSGYLLLSHGSINERDSLVLFLDIYNKFIRCRCQIIKSNRKIICFSEDLLI